VKQVLGEYTASSSHCSSRFIIKIKWRECNIDIKALYKIRCYCSITVTVFVLVSCSFLNMKFCVLSLWLW